MIQEFNDFLSKMNSSTSSNNKVELIKNTSDFIKEVLHYTYNPYYHFGVSSKLAKKRSDLVDQNDDDLFHMLDKLRRRQITGHNAISAINGFIAKNPDMSDLLFSILDKDLKIRCGAKLINKGVPGLIPEFSVALADTFNEKTSTKIKFEKEWFVSRKLDGVRCLTIIDDVGNISFFSRSGKEFETLDNVKNEIAELGLTSVVLDGEICKFDFKDNTEDFQGIIKEIRRKNHVIDNVTYYLFDMIKLDDFNNKKSSTLFKDRLNQLSNTLNKDFKYLKILEQIPVKSLNEMNKFIDDFKKDENRNNWEGLIARKNSFYQGKRSRDILKIKTFHDAEYVVQSVIFGPFRHVKDNVEIEDEMLSAVVIEHKGNLVQVGSGFSIEQRQYYHQYPEDILGKTITVQYFEESQNQLGEYSLRFPVIKNVYEGTRDT